ncbi:MAG: Ig-like domain repeat protein [Methanobrevibacter sp.]|nr:Ig-like domain repeat protein [Methanobrevibacter sp.]
MDKKYLIVLIILVILIIAVGVFALGSNNAKQDSKLEILTNRELTVGDNFEVQLTDLNNAPIANEVVNIKMGNNSFQVTTNNDGKAILKTDNISAGEYSVNVTFGGNDKFNSNSASQKLILKDDGANNQSSSEEVSQSTPTQSTNDSSSSSSSSGNNVHYDSNLNVYYDDNGVVVDPDGKHPMEVGSKYQDLVDRGKNIGDNGLE